MSSVYLKISSLLIRTLSKPIANSIKAQAREHEGFRKVCVSFAQSMHRLDMRLRLGLLQDRAAIDRQLAKEAKEASKAKQSSSSSSSSSTSKATTEEGGSASSATEKEQQAQQKKAQSRPKIKPLSEAKAIDSGANFISESFLFTVGLSLIVFETWRSRRKENTRRSDIDDRIADLETQNKTLTEKLEKVTSQLGESKISAAAKEEASKEASTSDPKTQPGKGDGQGAKKEHRAKA